MSTVQGYEISTFNSTIWRYSWTLTLAVDQFNNDTNKMQ